MSEGIILRRRPSPILLDRFRGASAGYSLRELSSQTTNVVKVRRDSDNAEQDFTAGEIDDGSLLSWVGNTASDNGFVTIWYDQSGNGNDATQSTAGSQPKIVDAGSLVTENGKAALYGLRTNSLIAATASFPATGDVTLDFFVVGRNTETNINNRLLAGIMPGSGSPDRRSVLLWANDSSTSRSVRLLGGSTIYASNFSGQALFNANYQGGGGAINARANASDLSVSSISNSGLNIQSNSAFKLFGCNAGGPSNNFLTTDGAEGYLQEVIYYFDNQSTKRQQIESNINNHYGIY